MKTMLMTTFTFIMMVFAFGTDAFAIEKPKKWVCNSDSSLRDTWDPTNDPNCKRVSELGETIDPEYADDEEKTADFGEEGSTSAAGATEQ